MTTGIHAIVWIDSTEAKIVQVNANATSEIVEHSDGRHHTRSKAGSREGFRTTVDHVFFQRVANDLAQVKSFVVLGPAETRTAFAKHVQLYDPELFPRLAGVEPADKMTDGELAAFARDYFRGFDTMIRHPVTH